MTLRTRPAAVCLVLFLLIGALATISAAPGADIADAARNKDATGLQTLLKQRADVNAPQPDGTTAIDVTVVREGKNLKGRMLGVVVGIVGKRLLAKAFANTVKAIEARNTGG